METLLNGKSENYLQKILYEPIIHNTAEFSVPEAALPCLCSHVNHFQQ